MFFTPNQSDLGLTKLFMFFFPYLRQGCKLEGTWNGCQIKYQFAVEIVMTENQRTKHVRRCFLGFLLLLCVLLYRYTHARLRSAPIQQEEDLNVQETAQSESLPATNTCSKALVNFDLVCVGDSITGDRPLLKRGRPVSYSGNYPSMLQAALRNASCNADTVHVRNFGRGSRTLMPNHTFSYRQTREFREALRAIRTTGNNLLVFLGTNDVKPKHWRGRSAYEAAHESLMAELCAAALSPSPSNRSLMRTLPPIRNVWLVIPSPALPDPRNWKTRRRPKKRPQEDVLAKNNTDVLDVSHYLGRINGSRLQTDVAPALSHIFRLATQQQQHPKINENSGAVRLLWRTPPSRCATANVHLVNLRLTFGFLSELETRLTAAGANGNDHEALKKDYALVARYFFDGIHPTLESEQLIFQALINAITQVL